MIDNMVVDTIDAGYSHDAWADMAGFLALTWSITAEIVTGNLW